MFSQRFGFILLLAIVLIPGITLASNGKYNYISAADLETRLTANLPTNIVDIQVEEEFSQHHIKGATPTYAYPVKSDTDRTKLNTIVEQLKANTDHLFQQGIPAERLLILEKGQEGWACAPLTENK